jgi:hypothetical protein
LQEFDQVAGQKKNIHLLVIIEQRAKHSLNFLSQYVVLAGSCVQTERDTPVCVLTIVNKHQIGRSYLDVLSKYNFELTLQNTFSLPVLLTPESYLRYRKLVHSSISCNLFTMFKAIAFAPLVTDGVRGTLAKLHRSPKQERADPDVELEVFGRNVLVANSWCVGIAGSTQTREY